MKVVMGLVGSVVIWALMLIPLWIFIGVRSLASPKGFWQELAMGVVGIWILGALQLVAIFWGVVLTYGLWAAIFDDNPRRGRLRRI
jgi:hypothetical protein